MIPLSWDEVAALDLGRLERGTGEGPILGIGADSRVVGPSDLFVALNSGVAFVADARARGAATLIPDDQHAALAALARLVVSKSAARVVAVVVSTGKTTFVRSALTWSELTAERLTRCIGSWKSLAIFPSQLWCSSPN